MIHYLIYTWCTITVSLKDSTVPVSPLQFYVKVSCEPQGKVSAVNSCKIKNPLHNAKVWHRVNVPNLKGRNKGIQRKWSKVRQASRTTIWSCGSISGNQDTCWWCVICKWFGWSCPYGLADCILHGLPLRLAPLTTFLGRWSTFLDSKFLRSYGTFDFILTALHIILLGISGL